MAKFALVIANSQYSDPGLAQLSAPAKDAQDFARVLGDKAIGAFDDVRVMLNQSEALIREAVDEFFAQRKPDDLLVLYFSGHGVRDEQGALYLAVTNTNRSRLRSTGIKSDFIRESMDQSRSRRQVLILDCCNSGAFAQGAKGGIGEPVGTGAAFEGSGFGRIVLTATDSTQFAWEGDKIMGAPQTLNSLFTHFLVKGLEGEADQNGDGRISVDELYDYAYEQIVSLTPQQTPGKWSYKQQGEILLRQSAPENIRPAALPPDLLTGLDSSYPNFREAAVNQLGEILRGRNVALARAARIALERVAASDDSRRVAQLAAQVLANGLAQSLSENPVVHNEAAGSRTPDSGDRLSPLEQAPLMPLSEAKAQGIKPSPDWIVAFWIIFVSSMASALTTFAATQANSAMNLESGALAGNLPASLLGGTILGLAIVFVLRHYKVLSHRKGFLIIPLGFSLGDTIATYIGISVGNSVGDTNAWVIGHILGGAIGGLLAGVGIAFTLSQEPIKVELKSILWILASCVLGSSIGLGFLVWLFASLESQIGMVGGGAVSAIIGGATAGAIAGIGIIYRLRIDSI